MHPFSGAFFIVAIKGVFMNGLLSLDKDTLSVLIDSVQSFALWVTLALAIVLLAIGLIIKKKFKNSFPGYLRLALGIIIGYSLTLICVVTYMQISKIIVKGKMDGYFYGIVGLFAFVILSTTVCTLIKLFRPNLFKWFAFSSLGIFFAYIVAILCIYPTDSDTVPIHKGVFLTTTVVLVLAIILLSIFLDRKKGTAKETKVLAYAGVLIALSFALSYVKFLSLPNGGSVTLVSMLPLMLFAYVFGAKKGLLAGVIYGLLQLIQSPQIYQPVQVLLDYPIAFGSLALAGIFKGNKLLKGNVILEFSLGMIVACVFRYASHVVSGTFVYHYGAPWLDAFIYSIGYNSYVLVDLAICVVFGIILFSSPSMRKQVTLINPIQK